MTNQERIQKAKDELKEWIEMHDGIVPSEDLEAFEKEVEERRWFIDQAEKVESLQKQLDAKIVFINNGWEEERYVLQSRVEELELFINDYLEQTHKQNELSDSARRLLNA